MKFEINDKVKLIAPVSYLKTSDNMPMLRPPDLVAIDEISSLDILKLTKKYFSKPFLSISGNEKICSEISNNWKKNF